MRLLRPMALFGVALVVSGPAAAARHPLPSLAIGGATVDQPDSGTVGASLTVRLSRPSAKAVRVHYTTQDGTAKAGEDYVSARSVLTIPPKQRVGHIHVQVLGGSDPEDDESFYVILSRPQNARLRVDAATVTIPFNHVPAPFTARAVLTTEASPAAHGLIVITCDVAAAQLAYTVTVSGLPHDPFELHIHPNVGQQGDNLLNLTPPPANGSSTGTTHATRTLLLGLYERPQDYFAAVHEDPGPLSAYTLTGFFSRP